ncbi:DMT family transporter [Anaerobacillus sp. CMMVII]|uniref:DMT family transporter n=1 Tax=Anaerobacillus sp. CMMVII TaxID=2755588 RepID=UPI0021B80400|nr:DMT family transporter [Anaerobacillus sp. CMMVII]
MSNKKIDIGFIHSAVLLFGLSGIFAKLISYHAFILVLGRMFFAAMFLLFVLLIWKIPFRLVSIKDIGKFFFIGVILVVHWSSFFYSIQISSVAIGLITFATFPVFSVFLEPLLLKERFKRKI